MSNQLIIKGCLRRMRFSLDIDLRIDLSQSLGVLGATGAGKTTLLRVIAGLEPEFLGRVEFSGEVWHDPENGDRVPTYRRGLGVVFQDSRLFPERTVAKNLAFAVQRAKVVDSRLDFETLIRALDISHLLGESVERLSGGERQRVALARTILSRPRLLLLDEPLSANDSTHRQEVIRRLAEWVPTESTALIYVSHVAQELAQLTQQLLILDRGAVVAEGETDGVLNSWSAPTEMNQLPNATMITADSERGTATFQLDDLDQAGLMQPGERVVFARQPAKGSGLEAPLQPESNENQGKTD